MTDCVLFIDAGNTRIKFAVADRSALGFHAIGHCATSSGAAEITGFLQQALFQDIGNNYRNLQALGVCVAGDAIKACIEQSLRTVALLINQSNDQKTDSTDSSPNVHVQWLSGLTLLRGLRNDYTTPATLGPDRWLAMYGLSQQLATQPSTQSAVLATFGTASTMDVLYWDAARNTHVFLGGIIIAGIHTALRSVSVSTAQLPNMQAALANVDEPPLTGVPNNTADALMQGALLAQAGAVRSMMDLVAQQSGVLGSVQCYLAGGAAALMRPYLPQAILLSAPVLMGLACVHRSLKITG